MKIESVEAIEPGSADASPVHDAMFDRSAAFLAEGTALTGGARSGRDGERLIRLSPSRVAVRLARAADAKSWALPPLKKELEVLDVALVPGASKAWAMLSDSFMVAVGRYVASVTFDEQTAQWSRLRQPFEWSPYSHGGASLEAIGAPSANSVFVYGSSAAHGALGPLGGRTVRVEAGMGAFDSRSVAVLVKKKRRILFYDAAGKDLDGFALGARVLGPLKSVASIGAMALWGRDLWLYGHHASVRLRLDADPPGLVMPPLPPRGKARVAALPAGRFGPIEDASQFLRGVAGPPVAFELVRSWDLNETPTFAKPSPFAALLVSDGIITFCKRNEAKLRRGFDFMARYVEVTIVDAPPSARAPRGIVLAGLRTPSGLTQVLCREAFAKVLAEHCAGLRVKRKRR